MKRRVGTDVVFALLVLAIGLGAGYYAGSQRKPSPSASSNDRRIELFADLGEAVVPVAGTGDSVRMGERASFGVANLRAVGSPAGSGWLKCEGQEVEAWRLFSTDEDRELAGLSRSEVVRLPRLEGLSLLGRGPGVWNLCLYQSPKLGTLPIDLWVRVADQK